MPLHLLGKKSWNVYNPVNIARVKRDEAEAHARAEAEEKRQQELDAERRLAILRGEVPPPLPPPSTEPGGSETTAHRKRDREREDDPTARFRDVRKKRKRFGEDDTDFEMRVAMERTAAPDPAASAARLGSSAAGSKTSNAPLVDSRGHIALFPEEEGAPRGQKNEEAEREAAKKRREYEDQYTMRFANAAGRDGAGVTGSGPWYASKGSKGDPRGVADAEALAPGTDVWGNEDPKRKQRDAARVVANDPLAMMKRGAAKARDVDRERRVLNEEKARELRQLRKEEKRREKRRRHHSDGDELEGFTLDGQPEDAEDRKREHGHREHRSGSHDRDWRDKHRHRHRSDHNDERERHRHRKRHESNSHHSGSRGDREDQDRHSPGQSRRKSAKTDHY
ncbi:hypothetical protein F5Y19DRAFT_33061 [Xylariaceae sp. FL1651]|nr:hypothetical protein F5Y19DRAFT_33061 [Xylariaceae sp. FL1651]